MIDEQEIVDERNYEQEAAEQGWRPLEEYTGPEEKWVNAKTFVDNGEKIAALATKKNRNLNKEIDGLHGDISELKTAAQQFGQYHREQLDKAERDNEALMRQLKAAQQRAVEEADGETYRRTTDEIENLQRQPAKPDPATEAWAAENKWYANDTVLHAVADTISEDVRRQFPTMGGAEFLDEVKRRVKIEMPHKFENPNRKASVTSGEDNGASPTPNKNSRTYENLPAEAKAACDRFVAAGHITADDYIKTYEWE